MIYEAIKYIPPISWITFCMGVTSTWAAWVAPSAKRQIIPRHCIYGVASPGVSPYVQTMFKQVFETHVQKIKISNNRQLPTCPMCTKNHHTSYHIEKLCAVV